VEHVGREDHSARQGGDEYECRDGVVAGAAVTRRELADRGSERTTGGERAEWRGEPEPAGKHQSRKRRSGNRVREEREPAQDDERAEQPARDRQEGHLNEPVLDERK
jgi:hypothetical protein